MEDNKVLEDILEHTKVYTQIRMSLDILKRDRCKCVLIEPKFQNRFGYSKVDALPTLLQHFYLMGKEDAIEELKEKL